MPLFNRTMVSLVKLWIVCWTIVVVSCTQSDNEVEFVNNRPIVGILAQEIPSYSPFARQYKSFLSASYVKFLESAGARVVPIWINKTQSYYTEILNSINGVLFPGGSSVLNATSKGYAEAGVFIYNTAKLMNLQGDYFPLWGTCQGFELLAYLGANLTNPLTDCLVQEVNLNLNFLVGFNRSKMFESAPMDIVQILQNERVTPNFHKFCLTPENLTLYMGDENWHILSMNKDANGLKFISSMESRKMPFYGVQFHPEKVMFEWLSSLHITHSFSAVKAAQYFANFFVNEARKNFHAFSSPSEELRALIYNYQPTFVASLKSSINEQLYLFK